MGIIASVVLLVPFWYLFSQTGKPFSVPHTSFFLFQLFGIALPEEAYFRGFLQERLGNNTKAVLIVSLLFSLMHLPQFIFYGDRLSLLTFFPSLVMGFLYLGTSNVLPSAIFHFSSNIVFSLCCDTL